MKPSLVNVTIRASIGAHILLAGIWAVLAIAFFNACIKNPNNGFLIPALICSLITILFILWLRGFKLAVTDEFFEYRDGRYRVSKIPLANYSEMKFEWIEFKGCGISGQRPQMLVITKDGKTAFIINVKPFGRKDFQMIEDALKKRKTGY